MEKPAELKSFTFARLSLLPALLKPEGPQSSTPANASPREFMCSVLTEFSSHYLDVLSVLGERPLISRSQWNEEAEEELLLQRSYNERQAEFNAWSNTTPADQQVLPSSVDLMQRPDCMDDIMALAIALCSMGPDYSLAFWTTEEEILESGEGEQSKQGSVIRLVPSRALQKLERLQESDQSLAPSYLSFLAALALAESPSLVQNGSAVVNEILSEDSNTPTCWASMFSTLRWFARELSQDRGSAAASATINTASTGESTDYYTQEDTPYSYDSSSTQNRSSGDRSSSSSSRNSKPRELGEENTFNILSHLAVISTVVSRSPAARLAVLALSIPVEDRGMVGQDATLLILFTLAVMPLSPEVRGSVFSAIANLVNNDGANPQQQLELRKAALEGWEMLEQCQVLPIHRLDQYPSVPEADAHKIPSLSFPPSSTTLVRAI